MECYTSQSERDMEREHRKELGTVMAEQKREFLGIWIPRDIWLDENLSAIDKVILAEVTSLDNEETGCYASNKYLAEFCQCSEVTVSRSISKLVDYRALWIESFNGRQRVLRSVYSTEIRQTYQNDKADLSKRHTNNIDNNMDNKDNNINNNNSNINLISIYEQEFDEVWQLYPRKQGKENAKKAYIKARKQGVEKEEIVKGLNQYIAYINRNNTEQRYIKQGSTWFNQKCWGDDYDNNGRNKTTQGAKATTGGTEGEDDKWFFNH